MAVYPGKGSLQIRSILISQVLLGLKEISGDSRILQGTFQDIHLVKSSMIERGMYDLKSLSTRHFPFLIRRLDSATNLIVDV